MQVPSKAFSQPSEVEAESAGPLTLGKAHLTVGRDTRTGLQCWLCRIVQQMGGGIGPSLERATVIEKRCEEERAVSVTDSWGSTTGNAEPGPDVVALQKVPRLKFRDTNAGVSRDGLNLYYSGVAARPGAEPHWGASNPAS